jgi:glycosyltransferase involved in cell wall biosynthesis
MQYAKGVSVVIPCYNREQHLEECIQSVLDHESDFPVEIIVADDGSKDDSIVIAQSMSAVYQEREAIRKLPESSAEELFESTILVLEKPADCKAQGAAPTRNRGVAQARFSYIAFLDSDDLFLPGHLKRLFHFLEKHQEYAAAVDQLYGFGSDIEKRWIMPYLDTDTVKLESFFLSPYFNPSVAMIRHAVLNELEGPFEESLRFAQDIDLFFRILEKYQIAILPEAGAGLREHDERSTGGKSPYMQYRYAEMAFIRAIARYPYPKKLARKRKAAIQFRLAQGDLSERKYFSAGRRLLHAFFLDPIRAILTVLFRKFT